MVRRAGSAGKVLEVLRGADGFVSSQKICSVLGISRSAVWKQVEALRRLGWSIEGVSSQGYRISGVADSLRILEMDPGFDPIRIGRRIVVYEETSSTNDDAWQLGLEGAEEGTVVLAEMQRAGRGRRGRQWLGPARKNLYASILLRPPVPPGDAPFLTLLASVALCEALAETGPLAPQIKWPNDVLLQRKKTAGILAEMHAEQESVHFLVLGIGVNLNMTADMLPADVRYPATSVQCALGAPVDRVSFSRTLLRHLDHQYDAFLRQGPGPVREKWLRYCAHRDGLLEVETPQGTLQGWFRDIDDEGALVLEVAYGRTERIRAGDVTRLDARTGEVSEMFLKGKPPCSS